MIRRILMSMDVLLDTRLGVMANINPAAATHLVLNRDYFDRDYDDWFTLTGGLVTKDQFDEAYANRGGLIPTLPLMQALRQVLRHSFISCCLRQM